MESISTEEPVITGDQTVCSGADPSAFTVVNEASSSGILSYQWQSSTTNCSEGFTDIPGATSINYDPPPLSQTTYYRVTTNSNSNCVGGECSITSDYITVTVESPTPNCFGITITRN